MPHLHHYSPVLLLLAVFVYLSTRYVHGDHADGGHQDLPALLSFKAYNPNATALASWVGPSPCTGTWFGVRCYRGRVAGVFLDSASLAGTVAPLLGLGRIRVLAVRNNSLSGTLPPLDNSTASPWLRHLLVSHNKLSGSLSISLAALRTLRAEHNGFRGGLEALRVPMLRSFNVSGNRLAGEISGDLSRFPSSAFGDNLALCGPPLPQCVHAYDALGRSSGNSSTSATAAESPDASVGVSSSNGGFSKISLTALMATGIGNAVLVTVSLAITVAMFVYMRRKLRSASDAPDAGLCFEEEDKRAQGEDRCHKTGGLVCFEGGDELRLDSLLKASAEVLGKGVSGSTYKAVLEDGVLVAVKRLSALQFPAGRSKAFDRHMRLVGRLRHRHVVSLRAYCNSNGERLLVYDFLPNGSLQSLLQANGGGARNLDWTARKSILFGAAQGLNYIHTFPARPALVHANVKPSNILLGERGGACVSECGLMRYATNIQQSIAPQATRTRCPPELFLERDTGTTTSAPASSGWHGYAAPELASGAAARATQESDVYSFGMVLLEVVAGEGSDETMGMVKIGMLCTAEAPEERPTMAQVLAMMSEFV
ncbi:putative leucine-rich repeat receptor-like protein kinase [Zea mays]|uniref:Receptor-kinase isolog n=2 Tax=Zea mays TaxID=4577 RepID=A0A1D6IHH7_MAIZE|nr:Probable leucine-rich repeat receptor-like protein kinase At1g68400 precursor [Zea mays]ONM58955.1 Receptor-kinase isolog [Zea mays]PWZ14545.1 putative leucine-rich repeat receptor-like protein kinase [Zea mays]